MITKTISPVQNVLGVDYDTVNLKYYTEHRALVADIMKTELDENGDEQLVIVTGNIYFDFTQDPQTTFTPFITEEEKEELNLPIAVPTEWDGGL